MRRLARCRSYIPHDPGANRLPNRAYWWRGTGSPDRALRSCGGEWPCSSWSWRSPGAPKGPVVKPEAHIGLRRLSTRIGTRPSTAEGMVAAVAGVCSWRGGTEQRRAVRAPTVAKCLLSPSSKWKRLPQTISPAAAPSSDRTRLVKELDQALSWAFSNSPT
jgi:hypothetical protein